MKIINSLVTLFMLVVIFILYVVLFHNKHIHPIGQLSKEVDEKMRCSKLIPLFEDYEEEHENARFSDRHITDVNDNIGRFDATYILEVKDKSLFGKPVLTVYCDKNERVLKYYIETE